LKTAKNKNKTDTIRKKNHLTNAAGNVANTYSYIDRRFITITMYTENHPKIKKIKHTDIGYINPENINSMNMKDRKNLF
jgi:hypothetical protein